MKRNYDDLLLILAALVFAPSLLRMNGIVHGFPHWMETEGFRSFSAIVGFIGIVTEAKMGGRIQRITAHCQDKRLFALYGFSAILFLTSPVLIVCISLQALSGTLAKDMPYWWTLLFTISFALNTTAATHGYSYALGVEETMVGRNQKRAKLEPTEPIPALTYPNAANLLPSPSQEEIDRTNSLVKITRLVNGNYRVLCVCGWEKEGDPMTLRQAVNPHFGSKTHTEDDAPPVMEMIEQGEFSQEVFQ